MNNGIELIGGYARSDVCCYRIQDFTAHSSNFSCFFDFLGTQNSDFSNPVILDFSERSSFFAGKVVTWKRIIWSFSVLRFMHKFMSSPRSTETCLVTEHAFYAIFKTDGTLECRVCFFATSGRCTNSHCGSIEKMRNLKSFRGVWMYTSHSRHSL